VRRYSDGGCDEARKVALGVGVSREGVVPRKRTRRWIYIYLPAYARAIELYRSQRESIGIVTGALSRNI